MYPSLVSPQQWKNAFQSSREIWTTPQKSTKGTREIRKKKLTSVKSKANSCHKGCSEQEEILKEKKVTNDDSAHMSLAGDFTKLSAQLSSAETHLSDWERRKRNRGSLPASGRQPSALAIVGCSSSGLYCNHGEDHDEGQSLALTPFHQISAES